MKLLSDELIQFFHKQNFTLISTIDQKGFPHNSCKGIVKISQDGRVYLLDLYKAKTYENLKHNPHLAVTAVDEHKFKGFCLKGKAKIVRERSLSSHIIRGWEKRITQRMTQRVLKNIKGEKGHLSHPEFFLPHPKYLIVMQVEEIVDLTPHRLSEATTYGANASERT